VKTTEAYGELVRRGGPVMTTREAAAQWQVPSRTASHRLHALEEAGLARQLRRGLWALRPELDPFALGHHLTAPLPAYVSLWSALYRHGMIEQIPKEISVISLDRTRTISTAVGTYRVHHIAPELFGGFEGSDDQGYLAVPEKALFDLIYIRAAAGSKAYFPELEMPPTFDEGRLALWVKQIGSARLRTLVDRRVDQVLNQALRR
jgi:predicted transcriptional regulator of viral defense system